jgi:hypothetical protein
MDHLRKLPKLQAFWSVVAYIKTQSDCQITIPGKKKKNRNKTNKEKEI